MQKEFEREVELPVIENPAKNKNKIIIFMIWIILLVVIFIIATLLIYDYFFDKENLPIIPVNNGSNGLINDTNNQTDDDLVINDSDDSQQMPSSSSSSSSSGSGGRRLPPPVNPICTPNCDGKQCGSDGCNASCGTCNESEECFSGNCYETLYGNITIYPARAINVGQEVYFDASSYLASSGGLVNYEWDFGDGYRVKYPFGGTAVTHTFIRSGIYNITLSIYPMFLNTSTDTNQINGEPFVIKDRIIVTGDYYKLPPMPFFSPIFEMKFEDNLLDSSESGLNGIWMNGTGTFVPGAEGRGVDLSNGAYINVSDSTGKLGGYDALSVSFWAKKNNASERNTILEKKNLFNFEIANKEDPSMKAYVFTNRSATVQKWHVPLTDTQWHHYVLVYNGNSLRIFLDGIEHLSENDAIIPNQSGKVNSSKYNLIIGRSASGSESFNGVIDELKIYNRSLGLLDIRYGFELMHADFNARTSQYIYAQIPGEYTAERYNKLNATIIGDNGYYQVLRVASSGLFPKEAIFLNNSKLPAGNYTLIVRIINPNNQTIDEKKEYFTKTYNGSPKVGINENNAIVVDGKLFFPVTPWGLRTDNIAEWSNNNRINSLYGEGFYAKCNPPSIAGSGECHDVNTWQDYLNKSKNYGFKVIGPTSWEGKGGSFGKYLDRNSNMNNLTEYVSISKNSSVLMWMWDDEPELGGESGAQTIPPQVIRAWTYASHLADPLHPVATNLAGKSWLDEVCSKCNRYTYLTDSSQFGEKTNIVDVIGMDYYPIDWATLHSSRVSKLADILDRFKQDSKDLIPMMSFVETENIRDDVKARYGSRYYTNPDPEYNTPAPTPEQLKMLIWLNVVHGVKGINWFNAFVDDPVGSEAKNYKVMQEFLTQITELTPVVLAKDSLIELMDDSNSAGNRVDTMIKEYNGSVWIFAVRLTEIDDTGMTAETNDITTTFRVENTDRGIIEVYNESRELVVNDWDFTDTFKPNEVHIYKIKSRSISEGSVACNGKDDNLDGVIDNFCNLTDRTWPKNYGEAELALWKNDKLAAVSITIDDNTAPGHEYWLNLSRYYGYNFTWFVITSRVISLGPGSYFGNWSQFQKLFNNGQDIQSHAVSHYNTLSGAKNVEEFYSLVDKDLKYAVDYIEGNLSGNKVITLAYPGGSIHQNPAEDAEIVRNNPQLREQFPYSMIAKSYYIAGRGTVGNINVANSINYMYTNSFQRFSFDVNEGVGMPNMITYNPGYPMYRTYRSWQSKHFHGLTDEIKANLLFGLDYIKANEKDFWVGTFREVALYGQERDTAKVDVVSVSADKIEINVSDKKRDDLFDYPLTVKVKLDSSWSEVHAIQDGIQRDAWIVVNNSNNYALVDAVPDGGITVVSKTGILGSMNPITGFWQKSISFFKSIFGITGKSIEAITGNFFKIFR